MRASRESGGRVQKMADEIQRTRHFAVDVAGTLYRYQDGVYRPDGKEQVAKAAKAMSRISGAWDPKYPEHVTQYIAIDAPSLWPVPPPEIVNVQNGLLDVRTGELMPHSPEHLSHIQLPVTYDSSARCDAWDSFFAGSLPNDARNVAYEVAAYGMQSDRSLQKAVLCIGPGEDGKSIYLSAVTAFIGLSNVSNLSLHRLEGDRFSCARLVGKLLNVCADLPSQALPESSIFKSIVGQDRIVGENKFERLFEFIPYALLLFSANHYPRVRDAGHANYRRWLILQFERKFTDAEKISSADLLRTLTAPSQLSGVLNKALTLLPIIRQRGFSIAESSKIAMEEFVAQTDPMAVWLNQHTALVPSSYLPMAQLLTRYNEHVRRDQRPEKTQNGFTRDLKRLRPQVETKQRTISGKVVWCYVGLRLE